MRVVLLVIDSFGIGALPDAEQYGDAGANTALHICQGMDQVRWPVLKKLGLGNCASVLGTRLPGCEPVSQPLASCGVMLEASPGKDTTTGHWELAGLVMSKPLHTFPLAYPSFPEALTERFTQRTGYQVLGNVGASGTEIIARLGERHLSGEGLILYTSADSVLQIAAHEDLIPVEELYRICGIARELCDEYRVGRVIARPFSGKVGSFIRTQGRRDFSMLPPESTLLDLLHQRGVETIGIGKIGDIFAERGLLLSYHDSGNDACLERLVSCLQINRQSDQFLFVNLVDTDMLYGHRRDVRGYHDAVARVDERLAEILELLNEDDQLIITADHGCDPTHTGTDHTREYVPLLSYSPLKRGEKLGIRNCFADVAASVAQLFNAGPTENGTAWL